MMVDKQPRFFYGYVIVAVSFVLMIVAIGSSYSFGVFFAPVLEEFGWTRAETSAAFSLGTFFSGMLGMLSGRICDKVGPRLMLTVAGVFLGLGYFLMSQIHALWQPYLYYAFIISFGLSAFTVPLSSTVAKWFVRRRGAMTGFLMAGIGAGTMVIPFLANWIITRYDWRTSFVVLAIFTVVMVIFLAQFMRRDPHSYGLLPDGNAIASTGAEKAPVSGFSIREAVRTGKLWLLLATQFCVGCAAYSILVHIVIFSTGLGFSATRAAATLSILGICNMAGRIVMGNGIDRIGSRRVLLAGTSILVLSVIWLQFANNMVMIYIFAGVFGFAYASSFVPTSPMCAEFFGLKSHGLIFGLVDSGFLTGGMLGPILIALIYDHTQSYRIGFLVLLLVSITGLTLAALLQRTNQKIKLTATDARLSIVK